MRAKVELFVDLAAVASDAAGALDHDAQPVLYDTLDWFRLTQTHILSSERLLAARARDGERSAWLLLAQRGRRAEAFGSWYTLRFAPIFSGAPGDAERVALVACIARALKRRIARLSLAPVDDAGLALLRQGFARAGWLVRHAPQTTNWVAHTAGDDFAAYWSKRPGQLRNTTRRKAVKANLTIRLLDSFDAAAWADYETVFAASWKGDEGSPAFLRALAERASAWGRLRMALAYDAAGAPLAAQFWTIDGPPGARIATIHKLAYVDAAKQLSPGTVLSQAMFAHVIDRDRPAVIDFGTGDDPYKADWMDERRPLHRLEAYRRSSPFGLLSYLRDTAAALVAARRNA